MTGQLGYRTTGKRDKNIVVLVYYISFKLDSGQISVLFYYMLFAGHDNCIVFYDFDFGTIKFSSLITFSNICFYIALDVFALELNDIVHVFTNLPHLHFKGSCLFLKAYIKYTF